MLVQIVLILAITTTGTCSTSCQSAAVKDICLLDPDISDARDAFPGYFYDRNTDACLPANLGYQEYDDFQENKFTYPDMCISKCRKNVPDWCFDEVANDSLIRSPNAAVQKWTYDSDATKCIPVLRKGGAARTKNIFDSPSECVKKCKVPDLGLCAYRFRTNCKHGDDLYIWYDNETQECKILPPHHCPTHGNAFYTFRQCYQRCGRFVENKCKLPIQNMSFCGTLYNRYGYNPKTKRCEMFKGCEDSGNNFPIPQACWETCAIISKTRVDTNAVSKNTGNRCVQKPDYTVSFALLPKTRYYYDLKEHTCVKAKLFRGRVTGESNLFEEIEDCKQTCMATYVPEPDWL